MSCCFRFRLIDASCGYCNDSTLILLRNDLPQFDTKNCRFGGRLQLGSDVYSSVYHSCTSSSVLKYSVHSEFSSDTERYGEAQVFLSFESELYAVVKRFETRYRTNLLTVDPPTDADLQKLYDERLYGSFFWIVSVSDELELIHVREILNAAILIDCDGFFVVTDVTPFEHD